MSGFNIRKDLKAYVKYNNLSKKIVPGSLVFRKHAPRDGFIWKEVPTVKCCLSGDCSASPWINEYIPQNYTPIVSTLDNSCNAYFYGRDNYKQVFTKVDVHGNLVWKRIYILVQGGESSYLHGVNVHVDSVGNPYFCHAMGIIKVDGATGDILWQKYYGADISFNILTGVVSDSSGGLFVVIVGNDYYTYIGKLNADTGDLISQTRFKPYPDTIINQYGATGPAIDHAGNLYVSTSINDDNYGYIGGIFKFDSNLNIVSTRQIDPSSWEFQSNIIGFGVDSEGGMYANGYGTLLYKINADGTFGWGYSIDTYNDPTQYLQYSAFNPNTGDSFWIFNNYISRWDPNVTNDTKAIAILKFDKDGNYIWATEIATTTVESGIYLIWDEGGLNTATRCSNDTIQIVGYSTNTVNDVFHIKMSAKSQTLGTFGGYTFRDVTELFTPVPHSLPTMEIPNLVSVSDMFSPANLYGNVTFDEFTDSVSITTIPLT